MRVNQAEIGARLDVSQQAVSKALRKMVNELVEKLPGVQGDASGVKWPKGKWGPRE